MAKILTWRDEWTLGIDTLDDDHREIVDLLLDIARRFGEAPEHSEGSPESTDTNNAADDSLYDALNHFGAFARRHFQREEEFIRTIEYPGLPDHRSEHALLMAEFTDLVRDLRERGVTRLAVQDLDTLKQWVVAHILGADRKFADHYFQICS
ncbi:MAG: hemerythrin domain-containing protein [Chromatiaceae bacterium]|nr:hemerythrin domain-containing protein [Chromatiaceae bacterium]